MLLILRSDQTLLSIAIALFKELKHAQTSTCVNFKEVKVSYLFHNCWMLVKWTLKTLIQEFLAANS